MNLPDEIVELFQNFLHKTLEKGHFLDQLNQILTLYSVQQLDRVAYFAEHLYQDKHLLSADIYQNVIEIVKQQQTRPASISSQTDSTEMRPFLNQDMSGSFSDGTVCRVYDESTNSSHSSSISKSSQISGSKSYPKILSRRYQLQDELGQGGMGTVYKAVDLTIKDAKIHEHYVAIKLMNEKFQGNQDAYDTLAREFTKTSQLRHDNIVGARNFEKDGDDIYIVMEYLQGMTLEQYIHRHPNGVGTEKALAILQQLALALDYAHKKDIIHSDFKPGNVFITDKQHIKILDFGVSRILNKNKKLGDTIYKKEKSLEQRFRGLSVCYASLEMFDEYREEADPRDDIYALACVAYELFTGGRHPFNKVPANIAYKNDLKPTPINGFSEAQWQGMLKGLAFKREDRTTSALQFLEDITPRPELTSEPKEKSKPKKRRSVLGGRYQLIEVIGRGGMGTVYKALDLTIQDADVDNPHVAIKLMNENFRGNQDAYKTLAREFQKTRALRHDNIVAVETFEQDGHDTYIVMEYLEGQTLKQYIKAHKQGVGQKQVFDIVEELVKALEYAHDKGMVHLDFKPGNVFLTNTNKIKVLDFGISRLLNTKEDLSETRYKKEEELAKRFSGITPKYASLEMIHELPPDPRDDIYALACVTYELLTGHHPFSGWPADQAYNRDSVPDAIANFDRQQWQGLLRGLAFERQQRSPSVREFWQDIQPGKSSTQKATTTKSSRSYLWWGVGGLCTCMVLVSIWWGWQQWQLQQVMHYIQQNPTPDIGIVQQKLGHLSSTQNQAVSQLLQTKIQSVIKSQAQQISVWLAQIAALPKPEQIDIYKIFQTELSKALMAQKGDNVDMARLELLLTNVKALPKAMQDNIYYNKNIDDIIITFYLNKSLKYVDKNLKLYDTEKINAILQTPKDLYPDSKRLSDFLENISKTKQQILTGLEQDFARLLQQNTLIEKIGQEDIVDVLRFLKIVDSNHPLLSDNKLLTRYQRLINQALNNDDLNNAELLWQTATRLYPNHSELADLKNKIAAVKAKKSRLEKIQAVKQNLNRIRLQAMEDFIAVKTELETLQSLSAQDELLQQLLAKFATVIRQKVEQSFSKAELQQYQQVIKNFDLLLSPLQLQQLSKLLDDQSTKIEKNIQQQIAKFKLALQQQNWKQARHRFKILNRLGTRRDKLARLEDLWATSYLNLAKQAQQQQTFAAFIEAEQWLDKIDNLTISDGVQKQLKQQRSSLEQARAKVQQLQQQQAARFKYYMEQARNYELVLDWEKSEKFYQQALDIALQANQKQQIQQKLTYVRQQKKLTQLFAQLQQAIKENAVDTPPQQNARYYFKQMQQLAPDDPRLASGVKLLTTQYQQRATQAIAQKNWQYALQELQKALVLVVNEQDKQVINQTIQSVKQQQQQQQQLAILLRQAQTAIDNNYLSKPEGKSAKDYLKKIQTIAPENQNIAVISQKIMGKYLALANTQQQLKQWKKAEQYYKKTLDLPLNPEQRRNIEHKITQVQQQYWQQLQKQRQIDSLYHKINKAIASYHLFSPEQQNAVYYLGQIQSIEPSHADIATTINQIAKAALDKGQQLQQWKHWRDAKLIYQQALDLNPKQSLSQRLKSKISYVEKQYQATEKQKKLDRLFKQLNLALSHNHIDQPQGQSAKDYLKQIQSIEPNDTRISASIAKILQQYQQQAQQQQQQQHWIEAIAIYQQALNLDLDTQQQERLKQAIADIEAIQQQQAKIKQRLAALLQQVEQAIVRDDLPEAVRLLLVMKELDATDPKINKIAVSIIKYCLRQAQQQQQQKNWLQAETLYKLALKLEFRSDNLALIQQSLSDLAKAKQQWQRQQTALKQQQQLEQWFQKLEQAIMQDQQQLAVTYLDKIIKQQPDDDRIATLRHRIIQSYVRQAVEYHQANDLEQAKNFYQQALKLQPQAVQVPIIKKRIAYIRSQQQQQRIRQQRLTSLFELINRQLLQAELSRFDRQTIASSLKEISTLRPDKAKFELTKANVVEKYWRQGERYQQQQDWIAAKNTYEDALNLQLTFSQQSRFTQQLNYVKQQQQRLEQQQRLQTLWQQIRQVIAKNQLAIADAQRVADFLVEMQQLKVDSAEFNQLVIDIASRYQSQAQQLQQSKQWLDAKQWLQQILDLPDLPLSKQQYVQQQLEQLQQQRQQFLSNQRLQQLLQQLKQLSIAKALPDIEKVKAYLNQINAINAEESRMKPIVKTIVQQYIDKAQSYQKLQQWDKARFYYQSGLDIALNAIQIRTVNQKLKQVIKFQHQQQQQQQQLQQWFQQLQQLAKQGELALAKSYWQKVSDFQSQDKAVEESRIAYVNQGIEMIFQAYRQQADNAIQVGQFNQAEQYYDSTLKLPLTVSQKKSIETKKITLITYRREHQLKLKLDDLFQQLQQLAVKNPILSDDRQLIANIVQKLRLYQPENRKIDAMVNKVADKYLQQANKEYQQENWNQALLLYEQALALGPSTILHNTLINKIKLVEQQQKKAVLDQLFEKVEQAIDANRLAEPFRQSALYYLREMQLLAPDDNRIATSLETIVQLLLAQADTQNNLKNWAKSARLYDLVLPLITNHTRRSIVEKRRDYVKKQQVLDDWFEETLQAIKSHHLLTPRKHNAKYYVEQMLALDANDTRIALLINNIFDYYIIQAEKMIKQAEQSAKENDWQQAKQVYQNCLQFPLNPYQKTQLQQIKIPDLKRRWQQQQIQINMNQLFTKVEQAMAKNYFTSPKGRSAADYLQQMREIDATDPRINQTVERIVKRYLGIAKKRISQQRSQDAEKALYRAEKIDVDNIMHHQIESMRLMITP